MNRPNILYIHSHDTGRYVQPYGYAVETPHLQQLAEEGILFRQAFSVAPTCTPSRAGLLTGQWPHSTGMFGLAHRGFALKDYGQHLVRTLSQAGYYTALVGVQHEAPETATLGYDLALVQESPAPHTKPGEAEFIQNAPQAEEVVAAAVDFLNDSPADPFFLSVGFYETHRPFPEPDPADSNYSLGPSLLPDTPETRRDMAAYKASARILDQAIGQVLAALETNGLADHSLVICTTDHGLAFPGMKCNLTDHGLGVMLILRGPGGFSGGRVCEAMISQIDLYPTLCELLEIEPPPWLQGTSLMPLVREETEQIHEEVFGEVNYHAAYEPKRAVRTQRWKYIHRFDDRSRPVSPNTDDSPSKQLWLEHGWRNSHIPTEQLYDLVFDPAERNNLAADPAMAGVLAEMQGRLERWMQATNDPLLVGPIAAPPGARMNDPDGLSPGEPPMRVA